MSEALVEFLDANILVRHLTQDLPDQSQRATAYVEELAEGRVSARMSETCVAEVVFVLTSSKMYRLPRLEAALLLRPVLGLPALVVPHKSAVLRALNLWQTNNIDFEDALNIAHMERLGIATIVSFDKHYDRVPTVSRREP